MQRSAKRFSFKGSRNNTIWGLGLFGVALAVSVQSTAAVAANSVTEESVSDGLQEIVVTATRREENLSHVAGSIAVFDGASIDLRGIRSAADLTAMAPGVDVKTEVGIQTNIAIRGISNSANQQATGPATTGIYLDDTPVQIRSIGNGSGDSLPDVFDLDRVEILRGPQGTLFGSGSEGGAIRFIANAPSLTTFSGYGRGELGFTKSGDPSYDAGMAAGGPIINGELGFRISAHDRHDGGYVNLKPYPAGAGPSQGEADANYSDTKSARATLLWSPVNGLFITPSFYVRQTNVNDVGEPWLMLSNFATQNYISGDGQNSTDANRSSLTSVKVDWTGDNFEVISNSAYYNRNESNLSDYRKLVTNSFGSPFGQNPFPVFATPGYYDNGLIHNTQSDWTQELRIQSINPDARLTWLGGLFYEHDRQLNYQNNRTPFFDLETGVPNAAETYFGIPLTGGQYLNLEQIITHDEQIAAFGELDYKLTARLKLTVGLRAARTKTEFLDTYDSPLTSGSGQDHGKHFDTPKTPKYALSFQINPENMVYASVSNGFRVGGVNHHVNSVVCGAELKELGYSKSPLTYDSDRTRSYEIGAKSLLTPVLRIATSAYYINWFNIIQPVDLVACGETFTANLGKAVSKGADLEVTFAPTKSLLLNLLANYNDAKFVRTVQNLGSSFNIVTSGWTLGQTPWTLVGSGEFRFSGLFSWNSYVRTDIDFHSKNSALTANTDPASATYNPLNRPDPSTLDVRLRVGAQVESWDVSLFVNNLTNNHPMLNVLNDARGGAIAYANSVRPITIGITAISRF